MWCFVLGVYFTIKYFSASEMALPRYDVAVNDIYDTTVCSKLLGITIPFVLKNLYLCSCFLIFTFRPDHLGKWKYKSKNVHECMKLMIKMK